MRYSGDLPARWPAIVLAALVVALAIGYALVDRGRLPAYRSELELWQDALEFEPLDPMVHNGLGVARQARGESDQAIKHFERAIELNPRFVISRVHLAGVHQQLGQLPEAIEQYRASLETGLESAEVERQLALLLVLSGRAGEAIEPFQKSLELRPRSAATWANLALALDVSGRRPEAVQAAKRARVLAQEQGKPGIVETVEGWLKKWGQTMNDER